MLIRFELADEVPEDGVSDGLALVGKVLAQPGHATLLITSVNNGLSLQGSANLFSR